MSVQNIITVEYINPNNIEAEVPHEQKLRTPEFHDDNTPKHDQNTAEGDQNTAKYDQNTSENDEKPVEEVEVITDHTLVPVVTVTKEEAVFTKGDVKLQKISVTENISDNKENGVVYTVINPVYSDIQSEVILMQPLRESPGNLTADETSNKIADKTENDSTEEKKKTRIPTRRFKQTVERIKQERRGSKEKKEDEVPSYSPMRRSSIPRLRGSKKTPSYIKEDIKNTNKEVKIDDKIPAASKDTDKRTPIKHVTKDIKSETKDVQHKPRTEALPPQDRSVERKTDIKPSAVISKDIKLEAEEANSDKHDNEDILNKLITAENVKIEESKVEKPVSNNGPIISESKLPRPLMRASPEKYDNEIKPKVVTTDEVKEAQVEETCTNAKTEMTTEVENDLKPDENGDTVEPVDEFDKIYEEIVTPTVEPSIDSILVDRIVDPETLETTFEEIIHGYEENKIHPLDSENVRPKKHIVKQQSLQEGGIPKQVERRLSLENIPFDDDENEKGVFTENKNKEVTKPDEVEIQKTVETEETKDSPKTEVNVASDTTHNELIEIDEPQAIIPKETNDKSIPVIEHVKVATPVFDNAKDNSNLKDDIIKTHNKEEIRLDEEVNASTCNKQTKTTLINENLTSKVPDSTKMVQNMLLRLDSNKKTEVSNDNKNTAPDSDDKNETVEQIVKDKDDNGINGIGNLEKESEDEKILPVPKGKVNTIISKIDSIQQKPSEAVKKHIQTEIPKKQSIRSKIAIFTGGKEAEPKQKIDIIKPNITAYATIPKRLPNDTMRIDKQVKSNAIPPINDKGNLAPDMIQVANKNEQASDNSKDIERAEIPTNQTENPPYQNMNDSNIIRPVPVTDNNPNLMKENINSKLEEEYKTSNGNSNKVEAIINSEITKEHENTENITSALEENKDVPIPKGKVSRIISRIDSHDEKELPKKELIPEIAKKKSVSSKIAMFERQTSKEPVKKSVTPVIEKPKVIHEILKTQPLLRKHDQEPSVEITGNEAKYNNGKNQEATNIIKENNVQKSAREEFLEEPLSISYDSQVNKDENIALILKDNTTSIEKIDDSNTNRPELNTNDTKKEITNTDGTKVIDSESEVFKPDNENQNELIPKDINEKPRNINSKNDVFVNRTKEMPSLEVRLQRIKSRNEESNPKKTKSMAELDLGDAVKGKVHKMIFRINSMEKLDEDVEKKEIINVKERPRKRSVSEKIALFERKLVPVKMEDTTTIAPSITTTPITTTQKPDFALSTQPPMTDEQYNARIEELNNAKINFGRMEDMLYIELRNGKQMPVLALGTALLDPRLIRHVVKAAIDLGFRAIDTAYIYGNEKEIGEGIKDKIDDGTVTREDLFIISKLWSTFHRTDLVEKACRASLAAMGLEYFDLYMIHNPMSFKEGDDPLPKIANVLQYSDHDYMDAWYGMEDLVTKGLVKSIGVSNFNAAQVARVNEKARVKPVINQVECHPYLNQQRLDQACSDLDVKLSCFGVLGSKGTPAELKGSQLSAIDDPMVIVLAAGLGVTPAQLLVRYQIELGHSVVVKSTTASHLWDNLQALTFNLTTSTINALNGLNKNKRAFTFAGMGDTHRNYPFRAAF